MANHTESIDPLDAGAGDLAARIPQLVVLIDSRKPCSASSRHRLDDVELVTFGRGPERAWRRERVGRVSCLTLTLDDPSTSQTHARALRIGRDWLLEDCGSKNGVFVNGRRARRVLLRSGDLIEIGQTLLLFLDDATALSGAPDLRATELAAPAPGLGTFVAGLAEEITLLGRVAPSGVAVLLHGESGTGKELAARAVHALSMRSGAFVAVNCGALSGSLLLGELFGHRRGAFTGASDDRPGLIRAADRGTLFLDEIGDLPLESQAAFLRVVEAQEVMPLGDARPVRVDLRVICATHRSLDALIAAGSFRADLYARISGFTLTLPPLRERRQDLGLLVATLLGRIPDGERVSFSRAVTRRIAMHSWPLNIRELSHCLAAATALAGPAAVELLHLPANLHPSGAAAPVSESDAARRAELVALLEQHGGNVAAVARAMGKKRMQIHRWVMRFGIQLHDYRR